MHRTTVTTWSVNLILLVSLCSSAPAASRVIYVDDDATSLGDGSSWNTAYRFLQDALADANTSPKPVEVWVAQGVYRPDRSASHPNGTGDRASAFQLTGGVSVKGGYAGLGRHNPDARDIAQYTTTLSGDLKSNDAPVARAADIPTEPTRADNSFHVAEAPNWQQTELAVLDGFVITAGNANGDVYTQQSGGGIEAGAMLELRNCVIEGNNAIFYGGGCAWVDQLSHCVVRNNYAQFGGGLYGTGQMNNCVIEDNAAFTGGGIDTPRDGAIYWDCVIRNNAAVTGGAIAMTNERLVLVRCELAGNQASGSGGAVHIHNDCTCWSEILMYQCRLQGNSAGESGAALFQMGNAKAQLWSSMISGNKAGCDGAAVYCDLFESMGGQGYCTIVNCTIAANSAFKHGGGVNCIVTGRDWFSLVNSILWGNKDESGLGTETAQIRFSERGSGTGDTTSASQQTTEGTTPAAIQYCCVHGWTGHLGGQGNTGADPMFVDADGADDVAGNADDDLHLQAGSPLINAGVNTFYATGTATASGSCATWWDVYEGMCRLASVDLDGNARVRGGRVDMGAYEFPLPAAAVIYVDDDAPGIADGSSWVDAFTDLQDALSIAQAGQQIRVAQGTYKPAHSGGDRQATFRLINGVTIKGGFAGLGSANPDARDIHRYISVLSGDLAGNDGPNFANNSENTYRVVTGSGTDPTAVLDGLTITAGNANYLEFYECNGAGMYNYRGSPTVLNCTFIGNFAGNDDGGGMGGAMHNENGSPSVTNCSFIRNAAIALDGGEGVGGAMSNWHSSPTIVNCTFTDNTAGRDGGAIWNYESHPILRNCLLAGNLAREGGSGSSGGAMWSYGGSASLVNCTFAANVARSSHIGDAGGGIYCERLTDLAVLNCIFRDNSAGRGPQIALNYCHAVSLSHSNIQGAEPSVHTVSCSNLHWGPANIDDDPLFAKPGYWDPNGTPEDARDDFWVNGDYHPKSQAGRWQPADNSQSSILNSQLSQGSWVQDAVTSPCIDAGDPMSPIGYEPFPNGGRISMGAYGGTAQASKSWFGGPVCETIIAGDINGDCKVDFTDFAILALHWLNDYGSNQEH
jgi:hypothetical protein